MKHVVLFSALCLLLSLSACIGNKNNTAAQDGNEENVCFTADEMPEFPGGMPAMMSFVTENIKYPEEAEKESKEGRVVCSFIVDKEGRVTQTQVVQSSGTQCLDDEAVRVVSLMPNWKPGKDKGEPVNVRYTIPVMFKLK